MNDKDRLPPAAPLLVDRARFVRLMIRLTVYYAAVGSLLFVIAKVSPQLIEALPWGGVEDISSQVDPSAALLRDALDGKSAEQVISTIPAGTSRLDTALNLFLAMLGTVVLMLPVSWVYKFIHQTGDHDHSLDETAFVLPAVVAGIVLVVQHSLALAFSLAGIVAGVQFRRALKDTYDTLFILVAIGVGIAAGVKALDVAVVLSVFFNYATVMVCAFGDGLESHHKRLQRIEDLEKKAQKAARRRAEAEAGDTPA